MDYFQYIVDLFYLFSRLGCWGWYLGLIASLESGKTNIKMLKLSKIEWPGQSGEKSLMDARVNLHWWFHIFIRNPPSYVLTFGISLVGEEEYKWRVKRKHYFLNLNFISLIKEYGTQTIRHFVSFYLECCYSYCYYSLNCGIQQNMYVIL